jgi:6-phosphogluconolactonase
MTVTVEYPGRDALMQGLARLVASELETALTERGKATLAVPGGTTPAPFLTALSRADLDWSKVSVMLTDERFLPENLERSNTRLLRGTLLQNKAAAATLIPFYAPAERPEDVLDHLEVPIRAALPLDVAVLGMGEDMHTASIFPGADRLAEALDPDGQAVLLPMRAPGAPEPRLTLTAPVLQATRHLHLLITGAAKKAALEQARNLTDTALAPVRLLLSGQSPLHVHYAD